MVERRWLYLVISILVSTSCAVNYAFAVLTDTLKNDFGFSQTQVDFVGTCGNLGQYFGLIAGLVYDKFGPKVSLVVAATLTLTGFGLLAFALGGVIPHPSIYIIAIFYFIGSHSQPWLDNASVVTNVHNFPQNTGMVVGLGKAFNGLGASVFSVVYSGVFEPNVVAYLVFLAVAPTMIALVGAIFAVRVSEEDRQKPCNNARLYYGYGMTTLLMIYLATISIYDACKGLSATGRALGAGGLVLFYLCYGYIPISFISGEPREGAYKSRRDSKGDVVASTRVHYSTLKDSANPGINGDPSHNISDEESSNHLIHVNHPDRKERLLPNGGWGEGEGAPDEHQPLHGEHTVWKAMLKPEFWLIFISTCVVSGSGLSVINNVSQISEALNDGRKNEAVTAVFVTIIAMGSATGRLGVGWLGSQLRRRSKWQLAFCACSMLMTCSCLGLTWGSREESLYATCLGVGISFGMLWATVVPLVLDLYGSGHLAGIYSAINFAPMLGSLCLATYVVGTFYDIERHRQDDTDVCKGMDCFQTGFIILSGLNIFSVICACLLWFRCYGCREIVRRGGGGCREYRRFFRGRHK